MAEKNNKKSKMINGDEINVQPENKSVVASLNNNQTAENKKQKKRDKSKKGISGFSELRIKKSGFMLTVLNTLYDCHARNCNISCSVSNHP
ncbi:hypothetical protein [Spiroplasma endosymbiont of Virgichneumon dumeticola]|uniref:hypothetical protein n=1 Tax=Spiroplasma endosymbiont of Virgichneumon dumeticola TaxID=3139323 RepID=UPI0035C8C81F